MMVPMLVSLCLIFINAFLGFLPIANPKARSIFAAFLGVIAALIGLVPCICLLSGHSSTLRFAIPWQMPFGNFSLCLDALSAFFLIPIFVLGALAAIYGIKYLLHSTEIERLGSAWFWYYLLWASMVLVVLASNGLLFLMAWELTVLSSFFLVVFNYDIGSNRRAGWIYLTASHIGTAFLFALFLVLAKITGSLEFESFSRIENIGMGLKSLIFLLAVIGFGTKAGFIPLHVWLPEAHPAAPSHVSALMSGVMIKTGIYGLVRTLFFLGHPAAWWGWVLLIIGLVSGILGVLFAISQHDLKRLLAYHSVENIGIIALGLGLGLLGLSHDNYSVAAFGFSGGLLHVLNHAVFKGLLFLGAGAVLQETGTRDIDHLGGLLKQMPWTGASFLVGCLSISGLPPFNGFVSEFLIYFGAFLSVLNSAGSLAAPGLLTIVGLSLIGGLASACFAKAFSIIFLGNPRSNLTTNAKEVPFSMKFPMVVLATLCLLIALFAPLFLTPLGEILKINPDFPKEIELAKILGEVFPPLVAICSFGIILIMLLSLALDFRKYLLQNRKIEQTVTWDCGYAQPLPSMQYTGSSFAQPLTDLFFPFLKTETHLKGVDGYFPKEATFSTHTSDIFQDSWFKPAFRRISLLLHRFTWIQNGVVQVYVLYITITLTVLLISCLM
ncbi:MAG: hydrogenase [Candidatus Riflebacteria bacterium]|nr:hydrogenase [Candidatus Riflebacteria bacterium]